MTPTNKEAILMAAPVGQIRNDIERAVAVWFGPLPPHGTMLYTHPPTVAASPSVQGESIDSEEFRLLLGEYFLSDEDTESLEWQTKIITHIDARLARTAAPSEGLAIPAASANVIRQECAPRTIAVDRDQWESNKGGVLAVLPPHQRPLSNATEQAKPELALLEHIAALESKLQNIVANAVLEPDARMGGATDCYAVPLCDVEAAREAIRVEGEPDESFYRRVVYNNGWNDCRTTILAAQTVPQASGERDAEQLLEFASWIMVNRPKHHEDHACARCVPNGDMLIEGFSCVYHEAMDIVGGKSAATTSKPTGNQG